MRILKTSDWFHRDGFPLSIVRKEPQERFTLHTHEFSEIVIIVGGRALHMIRGESWPVEAGDVFVVRGPEAHDYREIKDLRLINILFQPRNLHLEPMDLLGIDGYKALFSFESPTRKRPRSNRKLQLAPKKLAITLNYVDSLDHELKSRDAGYSFMAHSCFMQIVGYLSRAYGEFKELDRDARLCVSKAMDYLEAHLDQPVTIDELSRLSHMSKRSFFRAFQAATGSTPIAYLVKLRLTRAAEMLRCYGENVTSVAYKVGYNDSNFFARQFHAMFGFSPSNYRKRHEPICTRTAQGVVAGAESDHGRPQGLNRYRG
jgi:AraC-like DNA-binding protein